MTILLVPSLGRGVEDFDALVARLEAAGHRVVAPEPRGIRDDRTLDGIDLEILADDLLTALSPDMTDLVVVGHAFGNWVARMFAARYPQLVRGVVLLAAARREIPEAIRPSIDGSFDLSRPESERLEHLRRAYFAPSSDASVWLEGWHPKLAHAQRAAARRTDRALWWAAGGQVPILDVQAAADQIAPLARRTEFRDEFGERVHLALIADAGHALLPEQPEAVATAIITFVEQLRQGEFGA